MTLTSHQRPVRGATNEWLTPPDLLATLGPFDLDPCSPINRPCRITAETLLRHGQIDYDDIEGCECGADLYGSEAHAAHVAAAVLARLRDAMGAEEREEFAIRHRDGWVAGPGASVDHMRRIADEHGHSLVRRTVVSIPDLVSDWEEVP